MNQPTTAVDRIPLTRSVHYAVRGMPEVPNQCGPGVLAPSEITITYRDATDSQLGRIHAYVAGHIWVDGKELPLGLYGQHYFDGLDGWPEWLAEEARLHDPAVSSAGRAPATNPTTPSHRAGLRQQIAAALAERYTIPGPDGQPVSQRLDHGMMVDFTAEDGYPASAPVTPNEVAEAVMPVLYREWPWLRAEAEDAAVLPEPAPTTNHADVLRWAADHLDNSERLRDLTDDHMLDINAAANELRRLADETATETPAPSLRDQHRAAWHALTPDQQTARLTALDAIDEPAATVPCSGTLGTPHQPHNWEPQPGMDPVHCPGTRKPPMDPVHILGIDADDGPAAGARQDGSAS